VNNPDGLVEIDANSTLLPRVFVEPKNQFFHRALKRNGVY
jgi:hypothetical protein